MNSPPQLQVLTLDCWQYAALANWVNEVKADIPAADSRVTALASRSLSATSEFSGSGIARTEAKSSAAARKVVEKKGESILDGSQKDGRTGITNEGRVEGRKNEREGRRQRETMLIFPLG
jgi:hypothetical protein